MATPSTDTLPPRAQDLPDDGQNPVAWQRARVTGALGELTAECNAVFWQWDSTAQQMGVIHRHSANAFERAVMICALCEVHWRRARRCVGEERWKVVAGGDQPPNLVLRRANYLNNLDPCSSRGLAAEISLSAHGQVGQDETQGAKEYNKIKNSSNTR